MPKIFNLPTLTGLKLCVRIVFAAILSVWIVESLGVSQPYWAGISAAIVVADSFGGSIKTMLLRLGGTVVGLSVAIATVAIFKSNSLFSAAIAMTAAVLLCHVIGLTGGMRLAGATAMIPIVAVPADSEFMFSLIRAFNVLAGCMIGGASGLLIFPELAAARLRRHLQATVRLAGGLAAETIGQYVKQGRIDEKAASEKIAKLRIDRQKHLDLLKDMTYEFIEKANHKLAMQGMVVAVHGMIGDCVMMVRAAGQATGDTLVACVATPMLDLADCIERACEAFARGGPCPEFSEKIGDLISADEKLLAALAESREKKLAAAYPADELTRYMSIFYSSRKVAEGLAKLAGPDAFSRYSNRNGAHPAG